MAAVDDMMPAPPPPVPMALPMGVGVAVAVPLVRINRFALAAADAVVYLWFASMWVLLAGVAAALIGRFACGLRCPVVGAAWTVFLVSVLFFAIVWPFAALLLSTFVEPFYTDELKRGAAALGPLGRAVVRTHVIVAVAFGFLQTLGFLLKCLDDKETPMDRAASVIIDAALLGVCSMGCSFSIPGLAVRMWRIRRRGSASVVPIL